MSRALIVRLRSARLLMTLAGGAVVAFVAAVTVPQWSVGDEGAAWSDASEDLGVEMPAADMETARGPAAPSADPHRGLLSIGTLEDDRYLVSAWATPEGPRYTVRGRDSGEDYAVLIDGETLARWFPDLPSEATPFDLGPESSTLMLHMDDDGRP